MGRPIVLALALALALLLTGCGGDGEAEDYRAAADEICATATRDERDVPGTDGSREGVLEYIEAVPPIRRTEAERLGELMPPADLRDDHDALVEASERIVRALATVHAATEQESRQGAALGAQQGQRARQDALDAARALELDACGRGAVTRLACDGRRDPLLPRLKRLRPPGRESRGRVDGERPRRSAGRGREEPVRRARGGRARLLEAEGGPLPGGGRDRGSPFPRLSECGE